MPTFLWVIHTQSSTSRIRLVSSVLDPLSNGSNSKEYTSSQLFKQSILLYGFSKSLFVLFSLIIPSHLSTLFLDSLHSIRLCIHSLCSRSFCWIGERSLLCERILSHPQEGPLKAWAWSCYKYRTVVHPNRYYYSSNLLIRPQELHVPWWWMISFHSHYNHSFPLSFFSSSNHTSLTQNHSFFTTPLSQHLLLSPYICFHSPVHCFMLLYSILSTWGFSLQSFFPFDIFHSLFIFLFFLSFQDQAWSLLWSAWLIHRVASSTRVITNRSY